MNLKMELDKLYAELMKGRNRIPDYVKQLGEVNPEFLIKLFETRRTFRDQGEISEKYKELMVVCAGAARLFEPTVFNHTKLAMELGASEREVMESSLCAWQIGGMPSLIMCLNGLEKATAAS